MKKKKLNENKLNDEIKTASKITRSGKNVATDKQKTTQNANLHAFGRFSQHTSYTRIYIYTINACR